MVRWERIRLVRWEREEKGSDRLNGLSLCRPRTRPSCPNRWGVVEVFDDFEFFDLIVKFRLNSTVAHMNLGFSSSCSFQVRY